MKTLLKFIISITLIFCVFLGIIIAANHGNFDSGIRYALQYYLSLKGIDAEVGNTHFKEGHLSIDEIQIKLREHRFFLKGINSNIFPNIANLSYKADITIDDVSSRLITESNADSSLSDSNTLNYLTNNPGDLNASLNAVIEISPFSPLIDIALKLSKINVPAFDITSGVAEISIVQDSKITDITSIINFHEDAFFHSNYHSTSSSDFRSQASFKNIPISFLKYLDTILPKNDLCNFISKSFKAGIIEKGQYSIYSADEERKSGPQNSDNNSIPDNFTVDFILKDAVFEYDPDLPNIRDIHLIAQIESSSVHLKLLQAKIVGFDFKGSTIDINFPKRQENSDESYQLLDDNNSSAGMIIAHGSGKGLTKGFTEFIPLEVMNNLQKSGIDLSELTGESKANLRLEIPLNDPSKINLAIEVDSPSTSLDIFDDKINLRKAALKSTFINDDIIIKGNGIINDFDSYIEFSCHTGSTKKSDAKLKITTELSTAKNKNKNSIFSIFDYANGEAIVNFEYNLENNESYFSINSDLKNIGLSLAKLGINKKIESKAQLNLLGHIINLPNSMIDNEIDFKITGDDNLDIEGQGSFNESKLHLDLKKLYSNNTDLAAVISYTTNKRTNKTTTDIDLFGKSLDLHEMNFYKFFDDPSYSKNQLSQTKLKAKISKVLMMNDIALNNLSAEFVCDNIKCSEGRLRSNIGSRTIEVDLNKSQNTEHEIWTVKSTNAGALLKAIGAYGNMKAGHLEFEINRFRKKLKDGSINHIYSGNFEFEKFVLNNAPILTRMISFISLPGFINTVTNNSDIIFSKMNGKFELNDNVLTIKEGIAVGPYLNFSLNGTVNLNNRYLNIQGHVTPELYGLSSLVKNIPFLGRFVTGDRNSAGLISTPYSIKQAY